MDDILADDPDQRVPSALERADDPNERWQAMRWRVFKRTDLRCERCQAEEGTRVLRYLYADPKEWQPLVPGAQRPPNLYVTTIRLFVVPTGTPWTGEESDLEVLCGGCLILRDALAAGARHQAKRTDLRGQLALLS